MPLCLRMCGLLTKHWTYNNLSRDGQANAEHFISNMAELQVQPTVSTAFPLPFHCRLSPPFLGIPRPSPLPFLGIPRPSPLPFLEIPPPFLGLSLPLHCRSSAELSPPFPDLSLPLLAIQLPLTRACFTAFHRSDRAFPSRGFRRSTLCCFGSGWPPSTHGSTSSPSCRSSRS